MNKMVEELRRGAESWRDDHRRGIPGAFGMSIFYDSVASELESVYAELASLRLVMKEGIEGFVQNPSPNPHSTFFSRDKEMGCHTPAILWVKKEQP